FYGRIRDAMRSSLPVLTLTLIAAGTTGAGCGTIDSPRLRPRMPSRVHHSIPRRHADAQPAHFAGERQGEVHRGHGGYEAGRRSLEERFEDYGLSPGHSRR